jgi:hypothetical protein
MFREAMKGQAGRKCGDNITQLTKAEKGNSKAYTLTRLQKDNPEEEAKKASRSARAAEMVKAGTHTQAEAGIECGISQQAVSKALNTTTQKVTAPKVVARKPPQPTIKLADPHRTAAKLRGMLYISRKKEHGVRGAEKSGQSGHLIESKTRDEVANETGVSPRTIARDAAYAEAAQLTQSGLCEPRTPR